MTMNPNGLFCWTDIITNDVNESRDFYTEIFGWSWEEVKSPDNPYHMAMLNNEPVAGLVDPGVKLPMSHWATYFYTDNIDASIEKALELGGKIHMQKKDIPDWGALAVIEDPSGAAFCFWTCSNQEKAPKEKYAKAKFGHMNWTELMTNNIEAAGKFYCDTFRWTPDPMVMDDGNMYFIFKTLNDEMNCGMMEIDEAQMGKIPSHWLNYVSVESATKTLKLVEKFGGKACFGPMKIKDVGHIAVFQDPQGAVLGIIGDKK